MKKTKLTEKPFKGVALHGNIDGFLSLHTFEVSYQAVHSNGRILKNLFKTSAKSPYTNIA